MPARTANAKTTKGARAKVQEKVKAPAKTARAAQPKTTAKAATGAKTTRGARAKTVAAPAPAKRAAAAKKPAPKPAPSQPTSVAEKKAWRNDSKINKRTGFTEGTISDKIATALLKGGKSRTEIVHSIPDLPTETKKGTKFQAANVAAAVERQMVSMGFTVVQSYKVVPPKRGS